MKHNISNIINRLTSLKFSALAMVLLCMASLLAIPANAQTPVGKSDAKAVTMSIINDYTAWNSVLLEGKLQMDRLPISPSVKIYMQKGESVIVSVRAPFLGEVGRVSITGNKVLAVNKMKRVYVEETLGDLLTDLPVTLADLQNILLARAFVAGSGEFSASNYTQCDFYTTDGDWLVIPKNAIGDSVNYGFLFDSDFKLALTTAVAGDIDAIASAEYAYAKSGKTEIDISLVFKSKEYEALLKLNKPQYGAKPMDEINLDSRYKKVTMREFLKQFSF